MIFINLSKTLQEFEKIVSKTTNSEITEEENDYIDFIGFSIAQSLIQDIGKTTSLEIANHIISHCME